MAGNQIPQTIQEMKAWYKDCGFPSEETTRFFIGKDYKKPRAFGIYRDGDNFVVYKNKDDGTRAVRYKGPDEVHAVRELYDRLLKEVDNQRAHGHYDVPQIQTGTEKSQKNDIKDELKSILLVIYAVIIFCGIFASCNRQANNRNNTSHSYSQSYSNSGSRYGNSYNDNSYYDYSYNNDYDSGSWDSGDTDFGSDW